MPTEVVHVQPTPHYIFNVVDSWRTLYEYLCSL